MPVITRQEFLERLSERLGPANPIDPARVARAVAAELTAALSREGARSLAEELPEQLAPAPGGLHNQPLDSHQLFSRTAEHLQVELSHAAEYVTGAAEVIAEAIGPVVAERLRRDLPESVAQLLQPRDPSPEPPVHLDRAARTLAEAEPSHGLYAARPTTAQSGSIAEPNPHAETKLSTATGLTQERTGRTIATGTPPLTRK